jgi:hypothetical protein
MGERNIGKHLSVLLFRHPLHATIFGIGGARFRMYGGGWDLTFYIGFHALRFTWWKKPPGQRVTDALVNYGEEY